MKKYFSLLEITIMRRLTSEEIEHIVSVIRPNRLIPQSVAESSVSKIKNDLRSQLSALDVNPLAIETIRDEIERRYVASTVSPGESVGIITAQSIGERQTQMTLDTFHSAGSALKTVVTGVPRFTELMSATKKPKSVAMKVYPETKMDTISELRESIGVSIKSVHVRDLVSKIKYVPNVTPDDIPQWVHAFGILFGKQYDTFSSFALVKVCLDTNSMYCSRTTPKSVSESITREYEDIRCAYSPVSLGEIHMYIDTENIDDCNIDMYVRKTVIDNVLGVIVCGVPGITNVYYEKDASSGEMYIETEGSSYDGVSRVKGVDVYRTLSNNMWDVYETLGIEAVRDFLISEFAMVVSSDGTYINKAHVDLLVDTMTYGGSIMAISRYGQRKVNCGPLSKASFEESLDNFLKASVHCDIENVSSVSSAIMLGKIIPGGTGSFDVVVDVDAVKRMNLSN